MSGGERGRKLCLGTVQLGKKYGIANVIGRQPSREESFTLLKKALEKGISCFDTASVYGNSEDLLGDFRLAGREGVRIISKLPPGKNEDENAVLGELRTDLDRLHTKCIDCYLLHDAADMNRQGIVKELQKAKEMGLTKFIGVSVYEPEEACKAVSKNWVDTVQIPYNVFDQRLDDTDFFSLAQKNKVKVFARSMFLQGLLLMNPNELPHNLLEARLWLEKFRLTVKEYGFTCREAAFLFGLKHPGIDYVVFGVDTVEQLTENIRLVGKEGRFKTCYEKLRGMFRGLDRKILNPSLWG